MSIFQVFLGVKQYSKWGSKTFYLPLLDCKPWWSQNIGDKFRLWICLFVCIYVYKTNDFVSFFSKLLKQSSIALQLSTCLFIELQLSDEGIGRQFNLNAVMISWYKFPVFFVINVKYACNMKFYLMGSMVIM